MRKVPYRGKDIGGRSQLTETVLGVLRDGGERDLMAVLPHISLIRSPCFLVPLVRLLKSPDRGLQMFAAIALGSLGSSQAVPPLTSLLLHPSTLRGKSSQSLQTAIVCALGETGTRSCVAALARAFRIDEPGDRFRGRRQALVVTAWGTLAQRGFQEALKRLLEIAGCSTPALRERAVTELGVAFWHDPASLPEPVFQTLVARLSDPAREVREAAEAALLNLADLGCPSAEKLVRSSE